MITYTDFLNSDIGVQLLYYFKELIMKYECVKENFDELERDTNIIGKVTDETMYDIYELLLEGAEQIEEESMEYFDELDSDINDGVYED
jgi:hypothetical protein